MGVVQKISSLGKSQAWYLIGARYYDADLGIWTQVDPMRQFASPYLYAGNGFNPVTSVDPDGNRVVAHTKEEQEIYSKFTRNLSLDNAKRVAKIENDPNVTIHFIARPFRFEVDGQLLDGGLIVDAKMDMVYMVLCTICKDQDGIFVHELAGHGKQVLDYLNTGKTKEETINWMNENVFDLEKEAFQLQGNPKTIDELEEMGYGGK